MSRLRGALLLTCLALVGGAPCRAAELQATPPQVHAARILSERWNFRIVNEGQVAGAVAVDFFPQMESLWIHDLSTMGPEIREDVNLVFDPQTMAWRSAFVSGEFTGTHVHASYEANAARVRGVFARHRLSDGRHSESEVDQEMPPGAMARGAAIWMAHAMPWAAGAEYHFPWFAFLGAQFEQVTFKHLGIESVTVPAGTFEVHRIEQAGGSPGNVLFVTTTAPYRTVRVDIVGQPMTIELESVEAHPAGGSS
jgi:hypothetical protein